MLPDAHEEGSDGMRRQAFFAVIAAIMAAVALSNSPAVRAAGENLGTITAGSISGTTATFGGGNLTLDSGGLTFVAGNAGTKSVNWSTTGSRIYSDSESQGDTIVIDESNTRLNGDLWVPTTFSSTTNSHYPVVMNPSTGQFARKTDGVDSAVCGGGVSGMTVELGIVTSVTCTAPAPVPAEARIAALESEVAKLRELVASLLASQQ